MFSTDHSSALEAGAGGWGKVKCFHPKDFFLLFFFWDREPKITQSYVESFQGNAGAVIAVAAASAVTPENFREHGVFMRILGTVLIDLV